MVDVHAKQQEYLATTSIIRQISLHRKVRGREFPQKVWQSNSGLALHSLPQEIEMFVTKRSLHFMSTIAIVNTPPESCYFAVLVCNIQFFRYNQHAW